MESGLPLGPYSLVEGQIFTDNLIQLLAVIQDERIDLRVGCLLHNTLGLRKGQIMSADKGQPNSPLADPFAFRPFFGWCCPFPLGG
jgi:hypothetical protein